MGIDQPSIFVSYAHEDSAAAHALAAAMQAEGARVWLDQGELLIGDSLIERISEAIAEFDFVAALVSPASVGSNWCSKEIALAMSNELRRGERRVTVLPLRVGDVAMPASLADVKWLPLDPSAVVPCAVHVVRDATRHLMRTAPPSPPAPKASRSDRGRVARSNVATDDEPVRITGVDTEDIGHPLGDGSRGSALYRIPLRLNRVPPRVWSAAFPDAWRSPPAWTTMHRRDIASIQGDRIILDGTTIEELERYHLTTLKLVVAQLNERTSQHLEAERARLEARDRAAAEHERVVREAAERLRFDD